jgi:L-lactate dehydrogenase complex protein LldF
VCPVRINIPEVLVHLRGKVVAEKQATITGTLAPENIGMKTIAHIFRHPTLYEVAQKSGRLAQYFFVHDGYIEQGPGPLASWTKMRDFPAMANQSFREWWRERKHNDTHKS